jgi:hypothetical protein
VNQPPQDGKISRVSPKAIIKCQKCDWEIEGELPAGKPGYGWMSCKDFGDNEINQTIVEKLQEHHSVTRKFQVGCGHRYFDVFLGDGPGGKIEACSYFVSYRERGKER